MLHPATQKRRKSKPRSARERSEALPLCDKGDLTNFKSMVQKTIFFVLHENCIVYVKFNVESKSAIKNPLFSRTFLRYGHFSAKKRVFRV